MSICGDYKKFTGQTVLEMGRTYAGILGVIAFLTVIARGLVDGAAAETTLRVALVGLLAMALVGIAVGRLAAWSLDQSIRWQVAADLKAQRSRQAESAYGSGQPLPERL
jgi:hypothetical protein